MGPPDVGRGGDNTVGGGLAVGQAVVTKGRCLIVLTDPKIGSKLKIINVLSPYHLLIHLGGEFLFCPWVTCGALISLENKSRF